MMLAASPDVFGIQFEQPKEHIECSKCGKATKGYKDSNGETVCFSHKKKEVFSFTLMRWN